MICKCPSCNGALEYNPSHAKMECPYCGNTFAPKAVMQAPSRVQMQAKEPQIVYKTSDDAQETMECKVYTCTSCGGELMVNDVEVSTFCAYCGQPTVVFNRVSKELKPKYILPFTVPKEEAVRIIRNKFQSGYMVPNDIKNFEVDRLCGIYVPYFLYNIYCYDLQILETSDGGTYGGRHLREAQCEYRGIPVEASYHLNDNSSSLLGGFDFKQLKPFTPAYLSGFYADRYDINEQSAREATVKRVQKDFNSKIRGTVRGKVLRVLEQHPRQIIRNHDYVLLPVWFMTFRYKNEPYTILVNGQSGEMVGTVPFTKKLFLVLFVCLSIIFTIVCMVFNSDIIVTLFEGDVMEIISDIIDRLGTLIFINIISYTIGFVMLGRYRKKLKLTKEEKKAQYVKNRQEDT